MQKIPQLLALLLQQRSLEFDNVLSDLQVRKLFPLSVVCDDDSHADKVNVDCASTPDAKRNTAIKVVKECLVLAMMMFLRALNTITRF
jgi:hypothetical protein